MKRRYVIALALFISSGLLSTAIAQEAPRIKAFQPQTKEERAIVSMVTEHEKSERIPAIITSLVVSDSYGLYSWVVGETGGQTIVSKLDGPWRIMRGTGGRVDAELLQQWGVPIAIAQDLIQKMDIQTKANHQGEQR